jgi:mRNA interferase MazF
MKYESQFRIAMTAGDSEKPPRVQPRLKQGPKVRDLYWCDFPQDAQLPEFWKRRPVLVLATDRSLSGALTVIPCSSQPQIGNKWAFRLSQTIDDNPSWAICDKITTVAVSRLSLHRGFKRRVSQQEFSAVLAIVLKWLPKAPNVHDPDVPLDPSGMQSGSQGGVPS